MKKIIVFLILILIIVGAIFAVKFFTGEDSWICQNSQWVKHGNPNTPAPATGCGNAQNQTDQKFSGSKSGFIREVKSENGNTTLVIDEIEFLSGQEARTMAAQDTGCPIKTIEDCIPSLNNDFYIRNINKETKEYPIANNAKIFIRENPGSPAQTQITLEQLIPMFGQTDKMLKNFPFNFKIENGTVTVADEQYTP